MNNYPPLLPRCNQIFGDGDGITKSEQLQCSFPSQLHSFTHNPLQLLTNANTKMEKKPHHHKNLRKSITQLETSPSVLLYDELMSFVWWHKSAVNLEDNTKERYLERGLARY